MKTLTQSRPKLWAAAIIIGFCALSAGAFAAPPPGAGGGNGGGGGEGGGETPDLGDLFVLLRDARGVPILTVDSCQQPLAAPGVSLPAIAPFPACTPASATESCVIPVDSATCAVALGYETYTQEVDFGRTSVVRSPVSVLEQQLDDVVVNLSIADCTTLDPAGRLVNSTVADDGTVTSAAIDSPLQNLAIYRQLMLTGYLGTAEFPLDLKDEDFLNTAARGLGAAIDKTGKVSVDTVVYLNQIMGLSDPGTTTVLGAPICINVKEEVKGVVDPAVQKCFLNYAAYGYDRATNFGSLPKPPYIPATDPLPGWFEYLALVPDSNPFLFQITQGPILGTVFGTDPGFLNGNIGGFAQAADDTRAVINFMHSNPIPLGYETALTCAASGETGYDLSISEESGLQVPVRMVAGTEGREFTVAVANAGPDTATGVEVVVTAVDATGAAIPTFPRTYSGLTILPGTSWSNTEGFSVNAATTVTWTATATAEFDVNLNNNSVTETTTVTGTGGGQGGGQGGRP